MPKVSPVHNFRLTKERLCFLATSGSHKFEPKTIEVLERLLVNGESAQSIAKDRNVSRAFIQKAASRLYRKLSLQLEDVPDSFLIRTVAVHPELESELLSLQKKSYQLLLEEG
ncbi:hypothetical protein [Thalassotalea marina]|uniref:TrfB transcriptional repressor protein domain-containing protein n=1 Tax=Thalassotalea marina TaxID=1673741 RepID=A0A919BQS1_9GAMM|nr:hypothetical protein [Thalassotalea marina]GHG06945.1 hypothetical protein GCM10017161_40690 [Thalassotalea marina]